MVPRRIYYGWIVVVTLGLTEITSWGVLYYSFTVFLEPMRTSLGWSNTSMTGAFSLALLLSGVAGIPLGRWLDRFGPRALMTVGSGVVVALLLAWSRVDSLQAFYLIWAGLGIAMAAVLYEPAFWVVSTWFSRHRRRALTLLTLVAGLASVLYVPLTGWLVATYGWRNALIWLAALVAVGTLPAHALILRGRPSDVGLGPDGGPGDVDGAHARTVPQPSIGAQTALRGRTFWLLTGAFVCSTLGSGAVFVYLVPYLTSRGYAPQVSATVIGIIGLVALPGRLVLTPLGDWLPRGWITACLFAVQALALSALLAAPGTLGLGLFVILFGAVFGAITPARAALVAEYYGPSSFGQINGALGGALYAARGIAPIGGALLIQVTGRYQAVFLGTAVLALAAAFAALVADRSAGRLMPPGGRRSSLSA